MREKTNDSITLPPGIEAHIAPTGSSSEQFETVILSGPPDKVNAFVTILRRKSELFAYYTADDPEHSDLPAWMTAQKPVMIEGAVFQKTGNENTYLPVSNATVLPQTQIIFSS